jgi:hypothetical protein
MLTGCGFPVFGYLWGRMNDTFTLPTKQQTVDEAARYRNIFLLVGGATLVAGWISFTCWITTG